MKLLKLLMLSATSYAAMTAHAHAEPVSFAIFSALYTIGIPGAIANAISLIAIPAGLAAASLLMRPKIPGAVKPSDAKANFETGESSVMEGIGRVRVGGLTAFGNSDGSTRARLTCRLQGPIDRVEEYYIGGREVTVDSNGDVSSPPWARPGGSWANWQDKNGDGTETAWTQLISLFPSLWTTAHRVRGIAQSLTIWYNPGLKEEKYFTLYQNGIPVTEQLVRAAKLYDPRTGLTAWSDNGILACPHVLRRDPAFTFDMFDWDLIAAEANRADVLVATKTGTEKRARAGGIWAWESSRLDVLKQLLDSIGAEMRITDQGKIWFQLVDDAHSSDIDFTPADEIEVTWKSGPDAVERPNVCRLSYYSSERNYDIAEIDLTGIAWAHVEDEIERYGPKYFDLELPFCPSASQAQRIGRRKFLQARGDTGTLQTGMVGFAAWGLLQGSVELPDLGDVLPVRMEPMRVDDAQGSVEIPFTVWPDLPAWNPATDEAVAPDPIPDLGFETNLIKPSPPTTAIQITYPGGGRELRIGFTLPVQEYDVAETNYRTYSGGLPQPWQAMTEFPGNVPSQVPGGDPTYSASGAYVSGDFLGQMIDARVRVFNGDDGSYFSDLFAGSVVENNDVPGAPIEISATTEGLDLEFVLTTNNVQVASIQLQRNSGFPEFNWETVDSSNVRPGQAATLNAMGAAEYRARCLTSNGTAGAAFTYVVTAPEGSG